MEVVFKSACLIATGTWVGSIVFHSAIVAPAIFGTLDKDTAKTLLRALFPRFYILGLVCGGTMLFSLAGVAMFGELTGNGLITIGMCLSMVIFQAVSLWLVPHINHARDSGEPGRKQFIRLHRVSVILTLLVLVLGLGVLSMAGSQPLTAAPS